MTTVIHSFPVWLPRTQTWMHTQVVHLPKEVTAHVVCRRTENLDQFAVPNLHPFPSEGLFTRLRGKLQGKTATDRYNDFRVGVARRTGARVLHSHFGNIGWDDLAVARGANLHHVVTFYGRDVSYLPQVEPIWCERYRELFASVDAVLCEGEHMGRCVEALGCPGDKIRVQHLGIRVDRIEYRPREWDGEGPFRVLIAASFQEKKGLPDAMAALGRVREKVPLSVTVIGDAADEPRSQEEKSRILAAIEENGLGDCIELLGYQSHERLFEEAFRHHVFLSPSVTAPDGDTEGGAPVTLIEMAASGMGIVSTTHCDIPGVIRHGKTGLLADEHDVEGLAAHLLWFAENPDKWRPMLDRGRAHIEERFDADRQGERLAGIYAEVAGG